jgi:hypothetical protein
MKHPARPFVVEIKRNRKFQGQLRSVFAGGRRGLDLKVSLSDDMNVAEPHDVDATAQPNGNAMTGSKPKAPLTRLLPR